MDAETYQKQKEYYESLTDEELKAILWEGEEAYEPETWRIILYECKKRGIPIVQAKKDPQGNIVKLWETTDPALAPQVKVLLEEEGIPVLVKGGNLAIRTFEPYPTQFGEISLWVLERDYPRAKELLDAFLPNQEEEKL